MNSPSMRAIHPAKAIAIQICVDGEPVSTTRLSPWMRDRLALCATENNQSLAGMARLLVAFGLTWDRVTYSVPAPLKEQADRCGSSPDVTSEEEAGKVIPIEPFLGNSPALNSDPTGTYNHKLDYESLGCILSLVGETQAAASGKALQIEQGRMP